MMLYHRSHHIRKVVLALHVDFNGFRSGLHKKVAVTQNIYRAYIFYYYRTIEDVFRNVQIDYFVTIIEQAELVCEREVLFPIMVEFNINVIAVGAMDYSTVDRMPYLKIANGFPAEFTTK